MEKTNCNGCHYEHSCPMAEAGFGYFTKDVCPYIKDEHTQASNPAKVVFTKNDLQCLIEAIVNDCNVGKEDIVEVLEDVLTSVREENKETDSKRELEQSCLEVFDNVEYFVDLGLPSGTLWAKCNLGAEKETDFGKFFQWGDTQGYEDAREHRFSWDDYKWGDYDSLTKYNDLDKKNLLGNEDDSAFVATKGKQKMPTKKQLQELIEHTNHEWTNIDGVNGMKFINKKDSTKYIFIPAAGFCGFDNHDSVGTWGTVWSDSCYESYANCAWLMCFNADYVSTDNDDRCSGFSVRGVVVPQVEPFDEIDDTDDGQPVDLGLPSGTKWMKSNIGATKPSDFGKFFQWGDTQGYSGVDEHQFDWGDYKWGTFGNLTKYNNIDGFTLLEASDDSAVAATGGQASMPTKTQLEELINNTNHEWVRLENGVNGMKFVNKSDDTKYIFIPAAGYCCNGSRGGVGSWGSVWSASRGEPYASNAWFMYFYAGDVDMSDSFRCSGFSVRGVLNK